MSTYIPHQPHAQMIFEAANAFKRTCLLEQESMLFSGKALWTTEHFAALTQHFALQPEMGVGGFYDKLRLQLASCEADDVALMAELFWLVQLPASNLSPDMKVARCNEIWSIKPAARWPTSSPFLSKKILSGLGSAGPGYNNYLPRELAFAVIAFADLVAKPLAEREALLNDAWAFAAWLNAIPAGKGRQLYHTLCHLFFPERFERIFSQGNKNRVTRFYKIWRAEFNDDRPAMDLALLELRKSLELEYGDVVDHYASPVDTMAKIEAAKAKTEPQIIDKIVAFESGQTAEAEAEDAVAPALRRADNLIFYGPPGTGKTYAMQARMRTAFDDGEDYVFVAFHPSYSYEDFVGGLRPASTADGKGIKVEFHKGPFLLLCERAHASPAQRFTVFIDEINRSNVAKVFGELITLIEPSKRVAAGSAANESGAWVTLPGLNEPFGVPDNIDFVATMNTADRSIAQMDLALRRRFRFQACPPDPDAIEPRTVGTVDLRALLQRLNDRLEYLLDREHVIGHAPFIGITALPELQQVLAQRVIPLLEEYFFDDPDKVQLVLTGHTKATPFFVRSALNPATLFAGGKHGVGMEPRVKSTVTNPAGWSEADIRALYEPPRVDEGADAATATA